MRKSGWCRQWRMVIFLGTGPSKGLTAVHSDDVEHNQDDITMTRILEYIKDLNQNYDWSNK